ncbi:NUDIX domain protein [Tsuneonella dongtanensis]|uniref:NUDIX domain protein n=1 Tax=Tsuneonella dongtanensis TaxID=692370 RepID=A0A1B2ABJ6_9SPHN|nr:NUDIX domain-containing protein [Tsuneonella dongtanensis]ANY19529.1 NUDIX domain protein [Tsuneonella dongtanensis]
MSDSESRPTIPAATVVVFRRARDEGPPEILMTIRHTAMAFAGGMAVFPGGRVDEADRVLAAHLPGDTDEIAHRIAAVREALEETGLAIGIRERPTADEVRRARELLLADGSLAPVLAAMGWTLELGSVVPFARWHPKNERIPRIFDTRFYLADLGTGAVELEIDETETTHLFWTTAQGALDAADRGEIALIFPTRRNLERLALFGTFAEARDQAEAIPVKTITPWMEERDGEKWLMIPDDAGYPVPGEPLSSAARA